MALLSFEQWLAEKGMRTCLGQYPPGYGSALYPPLYFTPISASAPFSLTAIHGDEHPELLSPEMRKEAKKDKKKAKKSKKKDEAATMLGQQNSYATPQSPTSFQNYLQQRQGALQQKPGMPVQPQPGVPQGPQQPQPGMQQPGVQPNAQQQPGTQQANPQQNNQQTAGQQGTQQQLMDKMQKAMTSLQQTMQALKPGQV